MRVMGGRGGGSWIGVKGSQIEVGGWKGRRESDSGRLVEEEGRQPYSGCWWRQLYVGS